MRFLFGLVFGAFIGSAVTLLFAPRKGEETRKLVKDELDRMVTKGLHDVKEEITHQVDKVASQVDKLTHKGKSNGSKKKEATA